MLRSLTLAVVLLTFTTAPAFADELTEIVQKDLITLGFDPGRIDGEMNTQTAVAISQFQSQNGLDVTGEPSPQLAGIMKAKLKEQSDPGAVASVPSAAPAVASDAAALQAAQQACLQRKIEKAQEKQSTKKGLGSIMRAASRMSSRFGGGDTARTIQEVSTDVYVADATSSDLKSAAKDLGLKKKDVEACRNPAT